MYSESTPSRCALEYSTTPSLPLSTGPSPLTAMIECAWTPGAIGVAAIAWRTGLFDDQCLGEQAALAMTDEPDFANKFRRIL
jgi:hypothetical protein